MRLFMLLCLFLPLAVFAKNDTGGIKFVENKSWEEIKAQAKKEHKYIFIDCFATWCGPCKAMDKDVYTDSLVGKFLNNNFISVKVQMDSSKNDNEIIRRWYADAHLIKKEYGISSYPSFLFFSPEGSIIYRQVGYKKPLEFVAIAQRAITPNNEFSELLNAYRAGVLDTSTLRRLMQISQEKGDQQFADSVASTYFLLAAQHNDFSSTNLRMVCDYQQNQEARNYVGKYKRDVLEQLNVKALCTRRNLYLLNSFPDTLLYADGTESKFFRLLYNYPELTDSIITHKGFSDFFVDEVITRTEINAHLKTEPMTQDWNNISVAIREKYGQDKARILSSRAKIEYYRTRSNWENYAITINDAIKECDLKQNGKELGKMIGGLALIGTDDWVLNYIAWIVFSDCENNRVLKKALKWSNSAIKLNEERNSSFLDTKANLLYKLGKSKEAIETEEKAIEISNGAAKKRGRNEGSSVKEYHTVIDKIKNGIPTW